MSTAGSPTADGSPTAGTGHGGPAFDGAEIARRMVQAAAATQAVNAMSSTSSSTSSGGDWFKVLPKPAMFDPKDREAELSQFRDLWWQVEQYVVAVGSPLTLSTYVHIWMKSAFG